MSAAELVELYHNQRLLNCSITPVSTPFPLPATISCRSRPRHKRGPRRDPLAALHVLDDPQRTIRAVGDAMSRHFGNPTSGLVPATRQPARYLGATQNTGAEIIQFSQVRNATRPHPTSGLTTRDFLSVPGAPYVVRRPWLQMAIDIAAVLSAALFVLVTGLGIVAAGIILLTAL